jgi:hypothetical protein
MSACAVEAGIMSMTVETSDAASEWAHVEGVELVAVRRWSCRDVGGGGCFRAAADF